MNTLTASPPSWCYEDQSPANKAYRTRVALDRDNRLNDEEQWIYNLTMTELEFGNGFLQRAHP